MILFLTSSPRGIYRSEAPLNYKGFNPANGMAEELRRQWKDNARCLLISAFPDEHALNDRIRKDFEEILKATGLSFSCMDICDSRNGQEMADALHGYAFAQFGDLGEPMPPDKEAEAAQDAIDKIENKFAADITALSEAIASYQSDLASVVREVNAPAAAAVETLNSNFADLKVALRTLLTAQ